MTTAGRSVILAGRTVVIAVLGLVLTGLPYMYGVAISASLAVLVVMFAAVTLLPALLSYLGPNGRPAAAAVHRPPPKPQADGGESLAARWSHAVQRRPWTAAIVGDRDPARAGGARARHAPRLPRRRQRPAEHDDPPGLRPQHRGLRARRQRPAGDRRRAARRRPRKPKVDALAQQLRGDRGSRSSAAPRSTSGQRGDRHRDPEGLARRTRRPRISSTGCATTSCPQSFARHRHQRRGRRRDGGARGPERVHQGPHAAVHRRRGRALVPAPADRVPLAADLAEGGDHEPALGRRRLRRDDDRGPGRSGRRADRDRPRGADRAVHAGDDVRDPVRPLDGLRGLPDLAHPRGVPQGRRHAAGRSPTAWRRPRA